MIYPIKTSSITKWFLPRMEWTMSKAERNVYLTFDDGPHPDITPWVLDILANNGVKATFFCIGEHVKKYPEIYQSIIDQGHSVGNHTFRHPSGWFMKKTEYLNDVALAGELINSNLFRPPYGKLTPGQANAIKQQYRIIMWDVMSGDFDPTLNGGQVYHNVVNNTTNGTIIVMHDNEKAASNLRKSLQDIISTLHSKDFSFEAIPYLPIWAEVDGV